MLHIFHYEAMQGQGGRGSRWVHYIGGVGGCLPNLDQTLYLNIVLNLHYIKIYYIILYYIILYYIILLFSYHILLDYAILFYNTDIIAYQIYHFTFCLFFQTKCFRSYFDLLQMFFLQYHILDLIILQCSIFLPKLMIVYVPTSYSVCFFCLCYIIRSCVVNSLCQCSIFRYS